MENRLNKIKVAFFDVDNTLLSLRMYDENGKRIVGKLDYNDWLKYNIDTNAYINCKAPKGVFNLVMKLHNQGAKVYGLTECTSSFEYNAKYNRLHECYPEVFQHHGDLISIDDRHKKVLIMKMIAERDDLAMDEILFSDDSYSEILEAFDVGIFSIHTTEVMERF